MPNPEPAHAEQLTLHIDALCWERIQLVVRGHVSNADAAVPARFGLRPDGNAGTFVPATHAEADGDRVYLRFNVMQGPGLMPLAPGTWHLDVPLAPGHVPLQAEREFVLSRSALRAVAVTDHASLKLEISRRELDDAPSIGGGGPIGRLLKRANRAVRAFTFRSLVAGFRALPRPRRRRVLFLSASRGRLEGNLDVIHKRLIERGLAASLDIKMMLKPYITVRYGLREGLRLAWLFGTADVILLDQLQRGMNAVRFPPQVRVVQVWHASGAFKTVGYSRIGKPGAANPYSWAYKAATHALVSSDHDVPFYAEAFGIPESRVVPLGIPRMDRFFDKTLRRQSIDVAQRAFPQTVGRRVILFAPTFRGPTATTAYYDFQLLDFVGLHALCEEIDAVVLFKMHPHVRNRHCLLIPSAYRDRLIDATDTTVDVNDLLMISDLLITDYSSIVFEYSTLGRPMLFFAYDLDEYIASRDFYVPFREFVPGRIVSTFDEVLDAIRTEDYQLDKVADFARKHFAHLDGHATDRVIDELILP